MRRRSVLVGVGTTAIAGCLSDDPDRPSGMVGWRPEIGIDTELQVDDEPEIVADRDAATITVEGRSSVPDPCGILEIHSPEFDADESTLEVDVDTSDDADGGDCPDDDHGSYRITVEFDEGVPAQVVARELHSSNETSAEFE